MRRNRGVRPNLARLLTERAAVGREIHRLESEIRHGANAQPAADDGLDAGELLDKPESEAARRRRLKRER